MNNDDAFYDFLEASLILRTRKAPYALVQKEDHQNSCTCSMKEDCLFFRQVTIGHFLTI